MEQFCPKQPWFTIVILAWVTILSLTRKSGSMYKKHTGTQEREKMESEGEQCASCIPD